MIVLGVHGYGGSGSHDASAALVVNSALVACAEQERFSRKKHAPSESPHQAAISCLDANGISFDQVDAIASGWVRGEKAVDRVEAGPRGEWSSVMFPSNLFPSSKIPPTYFVKHHLAHIAAGYYISGFHSATCICIDGQGENESITIAKASCGGIEVLKHFDRIYSLGALYEATSAYCGLGFNVPGKLMGLAAYGKARLTVPLSFCGHSGSFKQEIAGLVAGSSNVYEVVESYLKYFRRHYYPFRDGCGSDLMSYLDVAASVQKAVEDMVLELVEYAVRLTGIGNVVYTGGVALNCCANRKLATSGAIKKIYVPPGPNDASCSAGAALLVSRLECSDEPSSSTQLRTSRLGREYDWKQPADFEMLKGQVLYDRVAQDLHDNRIVAWYQGRAEFGPRALGGRSLLARACTRESYIRLNRIKRREMWRPLAPSILSDEYESVFEEAPTALCLFMLTTASFKSHWVSRVPAAVHIDGTTRPHMVDRAVDERLYALLTSYQKLSGIPMILNTSMNVTGKPIVETPDEAIDLFSVCEEIDVLVINRSYTRRR